MNLLQQHLVDNYNRYVRVFTKKGEADTLARQAISLAYCKLETIETVPDDIGIYVYVVVKHMVIMEANGTRRTLNSNTVYCESEAELASVIEAYGGIVAESAYQTLENERLAWVLRKYVERLAPKCRKVVKEHVYGDTALAEIARRDGTIENTVKANYRHGIKNLQKMIAEAGGLE